MLMPKYMAAIMGCFLLLVSSNGKAETFKWVDSQGVIHFSDQPPEGVKYQTHKNDKDVDNNREKIIKSNGKTSIAYKEIYDSIFSNNTILSEDAKQYLVAYVGEGILTRGDAKRITTMEEAGSVVDYAIGENNKRPIDIDHIYGFKNAEFASPERTWGKYYKARAEGDVEAALECVVPENRIKVRQLFFALGKAGMKEVTKNEVSFEKIERDNHSATYKLNYKHNGDIASDYIKFVYIFGNWKTNDI